MRYHFICNYLCQVAKYALSQPTARKVDEIKYNASMQVGQIDNLQVRTVCEASEQASELKSAILLRRV